MAHRPFDLDMLLSVPYVDPDYGFSISPSGVQAAFSANLSGEWQIYRVPLDGSTAPQQLTRGPGTKVGPRWSPDGTRLGYALDLDGGERFDIYAYDVASGQHHNLTPDTPDSIQPSFSWSPDGSHIAFISDRAGSFDTYVMPSLGGPIRRVFGSPQPHWEAQWSPDGEWLAVVVEASGQDYATYIVPAAGGPATPIVQNGMWIPAGYARWSSDGERLAFSSYRSRHHQIGIYEVGTHDITWLPEDEGDQEQPTWSPDDRCLAYVLTDGPVTRLVALDLHTGVRTIHQVEDGIHHRPIFTPDGTRLVFVFDSPRHPDELWSLSLQDGSFLKLTSLLPPELRDAPFVMPTQVRYPSLDGQTVPALLYCPDHVKGRAPAILYLHGGPNWLSQIAWHPLLQHVVSRGWFVLAPNYRGSTGYGRDWQLANRFDLGGGDTQDIVAGADYLVREELASPGRIALTGRSYGGYLTMMCLTQYPNRWAAGSAVVPFLNWFTGHANAREDLQHWDLENFGDPEEDRDLYYERSPFFFLDQIRAPVQLICGAHDPRCPASESTQAHEALLAQGKLCDLVLYPDEGHTFRKLENVINSQSRLVGFLARALETKEPGLTLD